MNTPRWRAALTKGLWALFRFLRPLVGHIGKLGFGRQGALAGARRAFPARAHTTLYRTVSLIAGSTLIGTAVTLLTQARLGLSPYDVLVSGLQPRLDISFGQTVMVVSGVLFAIAGLLGQWPSRWGLAYVFTNGIAIDALAGLINSPESMIGRIAFVVMALFTVAAGIAVVVHSGSTGGAFELLMRAGELRGLDRRHVRTGLEVTILLVGIALGGSFGPATIAVALSVGPLLGVYGQALADHAKGRTSRIIDQSPMPYHPSVAAPAKVSSSAV